MFQAVVVGASLARHSWELGDEVTLQQGRAISLEDELTRTQRLQLTLRGK